MNIFERMIIEPDSLLFYQCKVLLLFFFSSLLQLSVTPTHIFTHSHSLAITFKKSYLGPIQKTKNKNLRLRNANLSKKCTCTAESLIFPFLGHLKEHSLKQNQPRHGGHRQITEGRNYIFALSESKCICAF